RFSMRGRSIWVGFIAVILLSSLVGCGSGMGKTVKVEAIVTLDGKPISGATVQFVPKENSTGRPASGVTGSDGHARMTTYNMGDGAEPGSYHVLISKKEPQTGPLAGTGDKDQKKSSMFAQMMKVSKAQPKPKGGIPAVYSSTGRQSGL